ncbi:hypothetical protein [Rhizobium rhizoryzae]|uniref:hypothetical protein n=1 Tax=Rhizobium rhizoryzae TaxID=451876 RepID=UPI0028A7C1F2|nr:hypothetical protein [Rhizobium rhizoryzae]
MTTVECYGEGGEFVAVKMAADVNKADAAIHRAKAMMVELTTFAEDCDPAQDEWSCSDGINEEEGSVLPDKRAEPSAVSYGGEGMSPAV